MPSPARNNSLKRLFGALGGVADGFAKFEQQHRDARRAMLGTLAGPFGDIARTAQWARVLSALEYRVLRACSAPRLVRQSAKFRRPCRVVNPEARRSISQS